MICTKFGWNWPSGFEEDFLISSMYFRYSLTITPWKSVGPSFEQTWIPFTQGCRGSAEEDFLISSMYFCFLVMISPLKRAESFNYKNLESSSPKNALCEVWLKLAQWFRRRRFLKFCQEFLLFGNHLLDPSSHLGKGWGASFEQTWIPFTQGCFVPILVEISPAVLLILSMYFCYLVIISPLKRTGSFIWKNLSPHHPRMLCVKFCWNWPSGSGGEDF